MKYCKVVAILNISDYGIISEELKRNNIPGVTVSTVQGYGDYVNNYAPFGFSENMKIEIYTQLGSGRRPRTATRRTGERDDRWRRRDRD